MKINTLTELGRLLIEKWWNIIGQNHHVDSISEHGVDLYIEFRPVICWEQQT